MEIYRYQPDPDNYESLGTLRENWRALDAFAYCRSVAKDWEPLQLQANSMKGHYGDFPSLENHAPVFSARAWEVLCPLIESSVEVLPVICSAGTYVLINVLDQVDCLDLGKTQLVINPVSGNVTAVRGHAFQKERLEGKHIFKTAQTAGLEVLVSDKFKEAVEANDLKGLQFKKLG